MKKLLFLILLCIPFKVYAISASAYIVMDADTKRVLEGSNINSKKLIASTTKIMTAIVALEYADINLEVEVDDTVLRSYGSGIYIEIGEHMTLKDMLYGLMLRSGNDAAMMIAKYVGGSMENFVALMNEKAATLGMKDTTFVNSSGLEEKDGSGNMSTAYDMALLMSYAMQNETFKTIVGTKDYTVKKDYKTYVWHNKNKLLSMYKYTTGGKTGFTEKARRTLVTSASMDNKNLVVVTLNDGNDFLDHKNLYEENFRKYDRELVLDKDNFKVEDTYYDGTLYIESDVYVLKKNKEDISVKYEIMKNPNAIEGDVVGKAIISIDGEEVLEKNIMLSKKVKKEKKGFFRKLLDFLMFWK